MADVADEADVEAIEGALTSILVWGVCMGLMTSQNAPTHCTRSRALSVANLSQPS